MTDAARTEPQFETPADQTAKTLPHYKTEAARERYLAAYDAALQAWPVPYESRLVPTSLGMTHVLASGAGEAPPLILLPSFAATALGWRPNVEALATRYRVFSVDVIGQSGKSAAVRAPRDRADYARWLGEVMDGLGVTRAPLVGCSFGAYLAASQGSLTPDRVEKVVMIGPPGVFANMPWALAMMMRLGPVIRWVRKRLGDDRPPDPARLHRAPLRPEDDLWRELMAVTMAGEAEIAVTNTEVFSRDELRAIPAPMLLLIGEHEMLYDAAKTVDLAREMRPGTEAEVVPGADHLAGMAQPEWVNERILRFLAA